MRMLRVTAIVIFGVLPSLLFFFWTLQGCRLPLLLPMQPVEMSGPGWATVNNMVLFALFGLLHSVLADWGINRVVYNVIAGVTAMLVVLLWQPMAGSLWQVGSERFAWWFGAGQFVLWLALHGWIIAQMGLRSFLGFEEPERRLVTTGPYAYCRHPMHANILLSLLVTPAMTVDRLTMLLAVMIYLLAAIPVEEARLESMYGVTWRNYRRRTALLIPGVL